MQHKELIGKQVEKNMVWQMRNINEEHIEKQEKLSDENESETCKRCKEYVETGIL